MHYTNQTLIGPVALGTYPNETRLMEFQTASDIGDTYFDDQTGYTYARVRTGVVVTGISDTAPMSALEKVNASAAPIVSTTSHTMTLGFDLPEGAITAGPFPPGTNIPGELDGRPVNIRIDTKLAQVTELGPKPKSWRCFHCDAEFHNEQDALAHFGASEVFAPICHLSPDDIRQMEAELMQYREEDTKLHRDIAHMRAEFETVKRSHGDTEYAKGIRDARMEGIEPIAKETAQQIIALIQEAAKPLVMTQGDLRIPLKDIVAGGITYPYQETIASKAARIIAEGNVTQLIRGHGKDEQLYRHTEVKAETVDGAIQFKSTVKEPKTYSSGEMVGAYMGGWNDAVEMAAEFIRSHGEGATPRFLAARLEGHNKSLDTQANAEKFFSSYDGRDKR